MLRDECHPKLLFFGAKRFLRERYGTWYCPCACRPFPRSSLAILDDRRLRLFVQYRQPIATCIRIETGMGLFLAKVSPTVRMASLTEADI
ncbi:MAG: hypothetical protein KDB22_19410 [Planctomycetales bacterium]|nr:hypothetical protein [Planctomycetales bacterium]